MSLSTSMSNKPKGMGVFKQVCLINSGLWQNIKNIWVSIEAISSFFFNLLIEIFSNYILKCSFWIFQKGSQFLIKQKLFRNRLKNYFYINLLIFKVVLLFFRRLCLVLQINQSIHQAMIKTREILSQEIRFSKMFAVFEDSFSAFQNKSKYCDPKTY